MVRAEMERASIAARVTEVAAACASVGSVCGTGFAIETCEASGLGVGGDGGVGGRTGGAAGVGGAGALETTGAETGSTLRAAGGGAGPRETPGSRVGGAGTRLLTGGGGGAAECFGESFEGTPGGFESCPAPSTLGAEACGFGTEARGEEPASSVGRGAGGGALGRLRTGGGGGVLFAPGLLETGFDRTGGGGGIDFPGRGVGFLEELSSAMPDDCTRQKVGLEPRVAASTESERPSADDPARTDGKIHRRAPRECLPGAEASCYQAPP
jgi:hypothetical protein